MEQFARLVGMLGSARSRERNPPATICIPAYETRGLPAKSWAIRAGSRDSAFDAVTSASLAMAGAVIAVDAHPQPVLAFLTLGLPRPVASTDRPAPTATARRPGRSVFADEIAQHAEPVEQTLQLRVVGVGLGRLDGRSRAGALAGACWGRRRAARGWERAGGRRGDGRKQQRAGSGADAFQHTFHGILSSRGGELPVGPGAVRALQRPFANPSRGYSLVSSVC